MLKFKDCKLAAALEAGLLSLKKLGIKLGLQFELGLPCGDTYHPKPLMPQPFGFESEPQVAYHLRLGLAGIARSTG